MDVLVTESKTNRTHVGALAQLVTVEALGPKQLVHLKKGHRVVHGQGQLHAPRVPVAPRRGVAPASRTNFAAAASVSGAARNDDDDDKQTFFQ